MLAVGDKRLSPKDNTRRSNSRNDFKQLSDWLCKLLSVPLSMNFCCPLALHVSAHKLMQDDTANGRPAAAGRVFRWSVLLRYSMPKRPFGQFHGSNLS